VLKGINKKLNLIVLNPFLHYNFTVEIEAHIIWLLGILLFFEISKQMGKSIAKKDTIHKGQRVPRKTNPSQPKPQSLPRRVPRILIYFKTI